MWSGPRNISTALMRSFENRPDCTVVDEPFYAHYLAETGLDHPGRSVILNSQPRGADAVVAGLLAPLKDGVCVQYQKHMSHHITENTPIEWAARVHNCFLLRDPRATIFSYVKQRENPVLDDLGFRQLAEIYNYVAGMQNTAPIVIDSDDLLRDPPLFLRKLCEHLNISFDDAMLSWPSGSRSTDGAWAPWWYANVEKSIGFEKRLEFDDELPPELEAIALEAMPYYDHLARFKVA